MGVRQGGPPGALELSSASSNGHPAPSLPSQGKGLFATQLIRKGETIFVERPLVAAQFLWNALYRYRGEHIPCLMAAGPAASVHGESCILPTGGCPWDVRR